MYFDFLVEKGKEPTPGMEYIYRMDMVWREKKLEHEPFEKYRIVINVEQYKGGYKFVDKLTGEKYQCSYNWAFAENTPENWVNIAGYESLCDEYKILEKKVDMAGNKIKTLKP